MSKIPSWLLKESRALKMVRDLVSAAVSTKASVSNVISVRDFLDASPGSAAMVSFVEDGVLLRFPDAEIAIAISDVHGVWYLGIVVRSEDVAYDLWTRISPRTLSRVQDALSPLQEVA